MRGLGRVLGADERRVTWMRLDGYTETDRMLDLSMK